MIRALLAALSLAWASFASAQEAIRWEGDLDAALDRAKTEGRPLLVAFNMDGEWANDEMVTARYRDPKVVGRSSGFICLAASKFDHTTVKEGDREVCSRFGSVTCAEHKQVERDARRRYLGGRSLVNAPQHLFVGPDGALLFRREWLVSTSQLLALMDRALREAGRGGNGGADGMPDSLRPPATPFEKTRWAERFRAKSIDEVRQALREAVALDREEAEALLEEEYGRAGSGDDRAEILRAMGQPGYERAVPFLLRVASGRDRMTRRHAIVSLEIVGADAAADPLFQAARRETDESVLKELLRAVAKLAPARKEVADLVLKRASDPKELLRGNALVAAADLADGGRAREAIRKGLADRVTDVRGCAVYSLGLLGEPEDLARLSRLEGEEPDFRVRLMIAGAKLLISTEGVAEPPPEYRLGLPLFAHDDIPHDGTWPAPRLGGRRGF